MSKTNLASISIYCQQCKGKFYSKDQAVREQTVKAAFGIIPNDCVNSESGIELCPYSNQKNESTHAHVKIN